MTADAERKPWRRRRLLWALLALVVLGLPIGAAFVYDASTFGSMHEECATIERDARTGIAQGAEPILLDASGDHACLLLHGFGSSPADFGELPQALHAAGLHVEVPLLPGHGTVPSDLAGIDRQDWRSAARTAYEDLARQFPRVSVVGFSMGATLAIELAAKHEPKSIVLWGVFFDSTYSFKNLLPPSWWVRLLGPVVRYFRKSDYMTSVNDKSVIGRFFFYHHLSTTAAQQLYDLSAEARREAPAVRCPVLMVHSRSDTVASPDAAREMYEALGASDKHAVWLERSDHILGWDHEKDDVIRLTVEFVRR